MVKCLEDLIDYFAQPEENIGLTIRARASRNVRLIMRFTLAEHEEKQLKLRALRNRQDLFQEEGILNLILDAIDKITTITAQGYLVALAGEAAGQEWEVISAYLYQLLGMCHSSANPLFGALTLNGYIVFSPCTLKLPLSWAITPTALSSPSRTV